MPFRGAGSVFGRGEETVGFGFPESGMAGHPLGLQKSRGGAPATGCPNSGGSVRLPIHPPARAGADPRPRPGLAATGSTSNTDTSTRTPRGGDPRAGGVGDPRAALLSPH